MTQLDERWPGVALDPVMRLRVLGATIPGVAFEERTIAAPFDDVWAFISDLEHSVPSFDPQVRSIRIEDRSPDGTRLRLRASPSPFPFQVELTEGLCLMRSAVFIVGMGAEPLGPSSTRFVHLEGVPTFGPDAVRWLQRPVLARLHSIHLRNVRRDLDGIERCLRQRREEQS